MDSNQSAQAHLRLPPENPVGQVIADFPARHQTYLRVIGITLGVSILLAASVFFVFRFAAAVMAVQLHGRAIILLHVPSLLLLLACLPLGAFVLVMTAINWNNGLTLYEHGLMKKQGLQKRTWLWPSTNRLDTRITHIKFGGNIVNIRVKLTIGSPQSQLVIRNRYRDMPDLVQKIRTILIPILSSWAQQQFHQNTSIEFHKDLTATWQGLQTKGHQLPWQLVDEPKIRRRKLVLGETPESDKFFIVSLNQITNLDLLLFLIHNPPVRFHQSSSR